MNLRDLYYFVTLIEVGHFGKAAKKCFISQPALSMQIKKLEQDLNVLLLERTKKSFIVTEVGKTIASQAKQLLSQADYIKEIARRSQNPYVGDLKIGIFPTLAPYFLPHIIPTLTKQYPNLSIFLVEAQTNQLISLLQKGQLHAAFLALPILENDIKSTPLFQEEFLLAVSKKHPLALKHQVSLNAIRPNELLLLEEGHCMRQQVLTICSKMPTETKQFSATSLETLRQMVIAGTGMTLMPKLACDKSKSIAYIPFMSPPPIREIGLVWRKTSNYDFLLYEMISEIKNCLIKLNTKLKLL